MSRWSWRRCPPRQGACACGSHCRRQPLHSPRRWNGRQSLFDLLGRRSACFSAFVRIMIMWSSSSSADWSSMRKCSLGGGSWPNIPSLLSDMSPPLTQIPPKRHPRSAARPWVRPPKCRSHPPKAHPSRPPKRRKNQQKPSNNGLRITDAQGVVFITPCINTISQKHSSSNCRLKRPYILNHILYQIFGWLSCMFHEACEQSIVHVVWTQLSY